MNRLRKIFCKLFPDRDEFVMADDRNVCIRKEPDEVYYGWNLALGKWGVYCNVEADDRCFTFLVRFFDESDDDAVNKQRAEELVRMIKERL